MHISRPALEAALMAAHARGPKLTGHLCSIGFREAAAPGIDNLEHGIIEDAEFNPAKQPDLCPPPRPLSDLDISGEAVRATIRELVNHHVAVTSTLAVFEAAPPWTTASWMRSPPRPRSTISRRATGCPKRCAPAAPSA
jgi:hypothetical protein